MSSPSCPTHRTRLSHFAARLLGSGGLLLCVSTLGGCQQQWARGLGTDTLNEAQTTQPSPLLTSSTPTTSSALTTTSSANSSTPSSTSSPEQAPVPASCGNGIVEAPEECDDGNTEDGDACLNICKLARCGDGVLWKGREACDDGNKDNSDACLQDCNPAQCGDGFVQIGQEGCDDGNKIETDACLSDCTPARCGDAVIWHGREACDDGNDRNEDACLNTCRFNVCGDGFIGGPNEQCDDGNQIDNDGCTKNCKSPTCGDGILNGDEECDDGNSDDNDNCLSTCRKAFCGDGKVWTENESCDPMDTVTVNLCSESMDPGVTLHDPNARLSCTDQCRIDTSTCAYCGDDKYQPEYGERCDGPVRCDDPRVDPNVYDSATNFASCSSDCGTINSNECGYCGDSIVQDAGGETCDDGNDDDTDHCVGCRMARCGDGKVWADQEECDPINSEANIPQEMECSLACGPNFEPIEPNSKATRRCDLSSGPNACHYEAWDCSQCREPDPDPTTGTTGSTETSSETTGTTSEVTETTATATDATATP